MTFKSSWLISKKNQTSKTVKFSSLILFFLIHNFISFPEPQIKQFHILCGSFVIRWKLQTGDFVLRQLDHTEHYKMVYFGHFRWFGVPRVGILYLENFLDVQNHLKVRNYLLSFVFVPICFPAQKVFSSL